MIGQNTGPLCRNIKVETLERTTVIERKTVIGSAIKLHGFIFNYMDVRSAHDETSDEADSF